MSHTIVAGSFTIERADAELTEALQAAMRADLADALAEVADDDAGPFDLEEDLFLELRQLTLDDDEVDLPPLFALAMDLPIGLMWLVRGEVPLALVPIKEKYRDRPKRMVRSLADWAQTFSPPAALGLVKTAYGSGTDHDDGRIHLLADLPLDGITTHRPPLLDIDEWLDELSSQVWDRLDQVEVDADVMLYEPIAGPGSAIRGHISVDCEDEDDAISLVTDALLSAFSVFTPAAAVREALSVDVERPEIGDLLGDIYFDSDEDDFDGR